MNRRLHNTSLALAASSATLAMVLVAGVPAPAVEPGLQDGSPQLAEAEAAPGPDREQSEDASEATRPAGGSHARSRQSVVMPYFSFARRG